VPSSALRQWQSRAARVLDEIESANAAVGGSAAGRRFAAQQVNHACVVILCSQFQRFCRDLHTECIRILTDPLILPDPRHLILYDLLSSGRRLDSGNPTPGNLGADFGRLGFDFWDVLRARDSSSVRLQRELDQLCMVRNAVAHQDFTSPRLAGRRTIRLADVRRWRRVCNRLAVSFDAVAADHLAAIMGTRPW
jgi:hypothetical protein